MWVDVILHIVVWIKYFIDIYYVTQYITTFVVSLSVYIHHEICFDKYLRVNGVRMCRSIQFIRYEYVNTSLSSFGR